MSNLKEWWYLRNEIIFTCGMSSHDDCFNHIWYQFLCRESYSIAECMQLGSCIKVWEKHNCCPNLIFIYYYKTIVKRGNLNWFHCVHKFWCIVNSCICIIDNIDGFVYLKNAWLFLLKCPIYYVRYLFFRTRIAFLDLCIPSNAVSYIWKIAFFSSL